MNHRNLSLQEALALIELTKVYYYHSESANTKFNKTTLYIHHLVAKMWWKMAFPVENTLKCLSSGHCVTKYALWFCSSKQHNN